MLREERFAETRIVGDGVQGVQLELFVDGAAFGAARQVRDDLDGVVCDADVPSIDLVLQVAERNADRGARLPETARFLIFRKAVGVVKAADQTEDGMQDSKADPCGVARAILQLDFDRRTSNLFGVEAMNRPKLPFRQT